MEGKTSLGIALASGSMLYLYMIIHQFLDQGDTPLLHMLISLAVFLVVIAPGLLFNALAYRFENRYFALFAGFFYMNSAFQFILSMLIMLVPAGFCFYAFYVIEQDYRLERLRKIGLLEEQEKLVERKRLQELQKTLAAEEAKAEKAKL